MPAAKRQLQELRDAQPKPLNDAQVDLLVEQQRESMKRQRDQTKARLVLGITFGQPVPTLLCDDEIDLLCEQARAMMQLKARHQHETNELGVMHLQQTYTLRSRLQGETDFREQEQARLAAATSAVTVQGKAGG